MAALLVEDTCQTQEELAESLGVIQQALCPTKKNGSTTIIPSAENHGENMTMLGHMSQDRSGHTWKRWNGDLSPPAELSRRCSFRLPFVSSMAHGLAHQHFRSYEEVEIWIDSWIASKDASFSRNGIRQLPEKFRFILKFKFRHKINRHYFF